MYRGTTPTFILKIPFASDEITALNLCFAQQGRIVLEKMLSDCVLGEDSVQVTLTESETLLFDNKKGIVEMQLRVGCGEIKMASNIMQVSVERILKDGCLV